MQPDLTAFRRQATQGNIVPVWKTLVADLETPVSAYLKIAAGHKYAFLLESVEGGERIGRYTFLGAEPFLRVTAWNDRVEIDRDGAKEQRKGHVFDVLRDLTRDYRPVPHEALPPFTAGAVGYAGYDLVRQIEPRVPDFRVHDIEAPDAVFLFFTTLLVFDHVKHEIYAIANVRTDEWDDLEAGYRDAVRQIEQLEAALQKPVELPPHIASSKPLEVRSNVGKEAHCRAVEKAKEYILAGDIFQVVLSQRLEVEIEVHPFQIYRALRAVNPSPYLFYLAMDDAVILGSSPEMLVKVQGRDIEYRPIAGTRPRGKTEAEDKALEADLLADEKELAEHVMLVDLGRNDVGRVSEFGSVHVAQFEVIERYSHVMHIVSGVRGKLSRRQGRLRCAGGLLPGGHGVRRSEGAGDGDHR